MRLLLYEFVCARCGSHFEAGQLDPNEYATFVLRTDRGEEAVAPVLHDAVFDEVTELVSQLRPGGASYRVADLVHKAFGKACDASPSGLEFEIGKKPRCPVCGSTQMRHWTASEPPRYEYRELPAVTHDAWLKLSSKEKLSLVSEALSRR